jgi:protein transport protein SEC61 subunit alpha
MFLKGNTNDGTFRKLKSLILTAATLGGMCIGVLTIFADLLGAIGSGTGILLTVTIIYGLYE